MTLRNSVTGAVLVVSLAALLTPAQAADRLDSYYAHETREDEHGVVAPWHEGQNGQLDERVRIAIEVYKRYPWINTDRAVMAAPDFIYNSHWSITEDGEIQIPETTDWMCGDLSQRAWSIIKGLTDYYRYSGDPIAFTYIALTADYVLDYGLTDADHDWPRFPISTPTRGKIYGQCVQDTRIQLDLCARLGEDLLTACKLTGDERYGEAVRHWADVFAEKCNYDPEFPPWNRYVDPSVVGWSDKLTGSTTMMCQFLDEVIATGYTGQDGALLRARDAGRAYIRQQLLPRWTDNEVWGRQYWDWDNPVTCGIVSMCMDYLLKHRDAFPGWETDLRNIMPLVFCRNGVDPNSCGDTYSGAWAFPESSTCCGTSLSYNQYTAAPTWIRYGVLADSEWAREIGRRMILIATYDSEANGVVKDGLFGDAVATGEWSNLAHPWPLCQVMEALAWMPETFGPARENHLMRSTAVVNWIEYGDGRVAYTTFDAPPETVDVARLAFIPQRITADGEELEERPQLDRNGYRIDTLPGGDCIATIRHDNAPRIEIGGEDPHVALPIDAVPTTGPWETRTGALAASGPGAAFDCAFEGNQVRVTGDVGPGGGLAEVWLDGSRQQTLIDCWNPRPRANQTIYSRSGLKQARHELRVVLLGRGNPISEGAEVAVRAVYYSAAQGEARFGSGGGPRGPQRMIFGYTGRKDYMDSRGNAWRPATEFVIRSGYGRDVFKDALWTERRTMYIGNTDDPELYRYGIHGKEFRVNVTAGPGTYRVRLLFANTPLHWFLEPDPEGGFMKHILNADINGERVISELNVEEAAGGTFRAYDAVFEGIEPMHGIIELKLTGVGEREAILQALEVLPMDGSAQ